jgi:hypothetical protein
MTLYYDTSPILSPRQIVTSIVAVSADQASLSLQDQEFGGMRMAGADFAGVVGVLKGR